MHIGKELIEATKETRDEERKEAELMECPVCKKGKLRILFNRASRSCKNGTSTRYV
jgi:hypothetical protein